ncbi:DUF4435 domain-containing protein [Lysinibacillus xylanilyticus]|uniref:DUF4435 domain-containing protein n=1 Tax=Lysinibacillus xylanilyticus TaxID=582475 RepID=UPI003D02978A
MDKRLIYLDQLMESDVVGFQKFCLKYKKEMSRKVLYCLIEGEDYKYYNSRVNAISGIPPVFIDCKGREGVIDALNLIKANLSYKKEFIVGFIDRDYYQIHHTADIFMTEYYSVESYYCLGEAVQTILALHCKLEGELYKETWNNFEMLYNKFVGEIAFFSVWCYLQVNNTNKEKLEFKKLNILGDKIFIPKNFIKLNSIDIRRYVEITLEDVVATKLHSVSEIVSLSNKVFGKAKQISDEEVLSKLHEINPSELKLFIRGKFEIQFLCEYLKLVIPKLNNEYNKKISQNLEDPLTLLANYAYTSPFLKNTITPVCV